MFPSLFEGILFNEIVHWLNFTAVKIFTNRWKNVDKTEL